MDDGLGAVAVSLRREKLVDSGSAAGKSDTTAGSTDQYRRPRHRAHKRAGDPERQHS